MQVTLQDRPDEVAPWTPQVRVTSASRWAVTIRRDGRPPRLVRHRMAGPGHDGRQGQPTEQTKAKIVDPSGNVIELKTCRDVDAALEISTYSYPEAFAHGN